VVQVHELMPILKSSVVLLLKGLTIEVSGDRIAVVRSSELFHCIHQN